MNYERLKLKLEKTLKDDFNLDFDIDRAEDKFYHVPKTDVGVAFSLCGNADRSFLSVTIINHKTKEKTHLNFSLEDKVLISSKELERIKRESEERRIAIEKSREEKRQYFIEKAKMKSSYPYENEYVLNHNILDFLNRDNQHCKFSKYEVYVPLYNTCHIKENRVFDFEPESYQIISKNFNEDGWSKRFTYDTKGRCAIVSNGGSLANIYVCEGWATGCRIASLIDDAFVICALSCGNLESITEFTTWLKEEKGCFLHLCLDNDREEQNEPSFVEKTFISKIDKKYDFIHMPSKIKSDFADLDRDLALQDLKGNSLEYFFGNALT